MNADRADLVEMASFGALICSTLGNPLSAGNRAVELKISRFRHDKRRNLDGCTRGDALRDPISVDTKPVVIIILINERELERVAQVGVDRLGLECPRIFGNTDRYFFHYPRVYWPPRFRQKKHAVEYSRNNKGG